MHHTSHAKVHRTKGPYHADHTTPVSHRGGFVHAGFFDAGRPPVPGRGSCTGCGFAGRAHNFSAKVLDIFELYDRLGIAINVEAGNPTTHCQSVTLHDACHLANVQGVRQPQRNLLGRIGFIELVEMTEPSACCGSAGIYNITHPEMADARMERKLANIGYY